jgi:hypothetical protein
MPTNPHKGPCAYPGCNAWARRDAEAPYCASHLHLAPNIGPDHPDGEFQLPGAPAGNQNRLLHGFYSHGLSSRNFYRHLLSDGEAGDLEEIAGDTSLRDELLATRLAMRRALVMLHTGATFGGNPHPLSPEAIIRLMGLTFQGARTVARLLAIKQTLGNDLDAWAQAIGEALDELHEEWGTKL